VFTLTYKQHLLSLCLPCRDENQGFRRVVEKLERSPVCQRLPLRSFLILPFQRITRIKLLVQVCLCDCVYVLSAQSKYATPYNPLFDSVSLSPSQSLSFSPFSLCIFASEHCEENSPRHRGGGPGHQSYEATGEGMLHPPPSGGALLHDVAKR
jgi:hypothetical protein